MRDAFLAPLQQLTALSVNNIFLFSVGGLAS